MDKICANCLFWSANHDKPEKAEGTFLCWNPLIARDMGGNESCEHFMGPDATEANVPNHTKNGSMTAANVNKLDGPTEVLICSCAKDFEWLVLALRCATKYLKGFQGITIAHPIQDSERFKPLLDQFDVRLHGHEETPGKGMLMHMVKMASADTFLPSATKYLLTTDSDGMFHSHTSPEHFAWNDKPFWIIRSWDSLVSEDPRHPGSRVISDNMQWLPVTEAQLGFRPPVFSMCVNIQMIPLDLLKSYRDHLERVHGKSFQSYMLEGRNEFPQTRVDFNALGAFFFEKHRDRFHWFDTSRPPFPTDRKKAFWSHGGITEEIRKEIQEMIDGPSRLG